MYSCNRSQQRLEECVRISKVYTGNGIIKKESTPRNIKSRPPPRDDVYNNNDNIR